MAKIDTSKIEGFESMTAEQKIEALSNFDFADTAPSGNDEVTKLKALLSKANGEAKSYKDELRAKQTEAERIEAERAERDREIEEELKTLRREKSVGAYKAKYLELGYDADSANAAAEALADGDTDKLFALQKSIADKVRSDFENNAIGKQTGLTPGKAPSGGQMEDAFVSAFRNGAGLR